MLSERKFFIFIPLMFLILAGCTPNETAAIPEHPKTNNVLTRPTDGMVMVYVPEATFKLSEQGKGGKGTHDVKLDGFWIDQTEVTNSHYKQCVQAGDCLPPTTCSWGEPTYDDPAYDDHPVICVTWEMSVSYCTWAGGRLPTEAEWDYAARGPERYAYVWGNNFDPEKLNFCDVNCPQSDSQFDDGYGLTAPVGSYPDGISWFGALDMNGNVWEWVADWYAPYRFEFEDNPRGPNRGDERVIRGGSWYDDPDFLRADHRHPFNPNDYNHLIGFRYAVSATGGAQ